MVLRESSHKSRTGHTTFQSYTCFESLELDSRGDSFVSKCENQGLLTPNSNWGLKPPNLQNLNCKTTIFIPKRVAIRSVFQEERMLGIFLREFSHENRTGHTTFHTGVPRSQDTTPHWDPTVGLRLVLHRVPRGGRSFS